MRLLVLYEELAGYFWACAVNFAKCYKCEIVIVRSAVNPVAPFRFEETEMVRQVDRSGLGEKDILELAAGFSPDAILCGGWSYRPYLKICRHFHGKIPVVLGFDNWWEASFKQRLLTVFARHYFSGHFSHCFVPGDMQKEFAVRLGFREQFIAEGAYCCDTEYFNAVFRKTNEAKRSSFPRKFIFAGRYAPEKGVQLLWQAFAELQDESPNEWELWCLGKGSLPAFQHPKIKHLGFVQPGDIDEYMKHTGVFILPSVFEPWGVVVHEFASAGFPLVLSDKTGAASLFLKTGENGFLFRSGDKNELARALKSIMELPDHELYRMGESSHHLAQRLTPDLWAGKLHSLIASR